MRRENKRWLGWKRITNVTQRYALSMENIMAAGAVGRAMNYGLDGQDTNIYSESSNFSILTS